MCLCHCLSFSFIFHFLSFPIHCSFIVLSFFFHCSFIVLSLFFHCSFIVLSLFFHCSFIVLSLFFHCSFIVLSLFFHCSFIVLSLFFHYSFIFLSFFFHFLGCSKSVFFWGLNFVTISLDSSCVKNQFLGPTRWRGGIPLWALFSFFSPFFLSFVLLKHTQPKEAAMRSLLCRPRRLTLI